MSMGSVESPSLAGSALAVFSLLEDDPKLRGKGLSAAFARSFPRPLVETGLGPPRDPHTDLACLPPPPTRRIARTCGSGEWA